MKTFYNTTRTILILSIFITAGSFAISAEGNDLGLKEIVDLTLDNDFSVQLSASQSEIARQGYLQVISSGKPSVYFSTDTFQNPLYGYTNSPIPEGATVLDNVHSLGGGASLSQFLPTGGSASLSLSNRVNFAATAAGDSLVTQSPSFSLSLNQPVFVNGRFIDFRLLNISERIGEISLEKAVLDSRNLKNGSLFRTFALIVQVHSLRNSLVYLENTLDLAVLRLEQARQDRERGRISESDYLSAELGIGEQKQALLDIRLQLLKAEQLLKATLGIEDDIQNYTLFDDFTAIELPDSPEALLALAYKDNFDVAKAKLQLEEADLSSQAAGTSDRPTVSLSFSLEPGYSQNYAGSDFGSSLSGLFDEDAETAVSINIGLNVPAYTGGRTKIRKDIEAETRKIADLSLNETGRKINDTMTELFLQQMIYTERIDLLSSSIEYDKALLEREEDRLSFGSSTTADVETVRLQLLADVNDRLRYKGECFLNALDIYALAGYDLTEILLR
jgi:outer membrane protein TolC